MALSEALRKTVTQASARYSRTGDRLKIKEGRNVFRIINPKGAPWIGADEAFFKDVGVHWIKLVPDGKPVAVVGAADICYQEPNPVAAAVAVAVNAAPDEDSRKFLADMGARHTIFVNAIERTAKGDSQDVGVLEMTKTTFNEVLNLMMIFEDNGGDLFDPVAGADLIITRVGKGLDTKYSVQARPGASAPVAAEAVGKAIDLPALIAKEFFQGKEALALSAISSVSGISIEDLTGRAPTGIAFAGRTPTPALAAPSSVVPGAVVETAFVVPVKPPAAVVAAAPVEPVEDPALVALRAQLADAEAAAKVRSAKLAADAAAVASEAAGDPDVSVAALSVSEEQDILAELAKL